MLDNRYRADLHRIASSSVLSSISLGCIDALLRLFATWATTSEVEGGSRCIISRWGFACGSDESYERSKGQLYVPPTTIYYDTDDLPEKIVKVVTCSESLFSYHDDQHSLSFSLSSAELDLQWVYLVYHPLRAALLSEYHDLTTSEARKQVVKVEDEVIQP
jgi:hypothetical protein